MIAETLLRVPEVQPLLGSFTLHRHQLSAVQRLRVAIDEFNGAVLCDDVGMGKTLVALALARDFQRRLIVIPAALTSMWRGALTATGIDASLATFEALSRADQRKAPDTPPQHYDLVIIDEAHHLRNPRTNRYLALESMARAARVLLLTATPIHNRRDDLVALLSLFLGSRARALTSAELALCVIRREKKQLGQPLGIPAVLPVVYHDVSDDRPMVERLMNLPPALPPRDGGLAGALISRALVHQLASSHAALREAVKRRLARGTALRSALEAGTYPTTRELETWVYADGALQLGFAELLAAPTPGHRELLAAVKAHLEALDELRAGLVVAAAIDDERARILNAIRDGDRTAKIVAFTQYAATASMLFVRLASVGGVSMLTSHGARVAGGSLTRLEAITRFAPVASGARRPSRAEAIDLLLTTDLLSEGVNLQDAGTVVHLDIPWTVARMEQRVGRAARMGSPHPAVAVHALRPPRSAADVLHSEAIVERKWAVANSAVGTSAPMPRFRPKANFSLVVATDSVPGNAERLRIILESWLASSVHDPSDACAGEEATLVATVNGRKSGFVAAVSVLGTPRLLVAFGDRLASDLSTQIERCEDIDGVETSSDAADVAVVFGMIRDWRNAEMAAESAGLGASTAQHRKEIINRIDSLVEAAPPHLRASRLAAATRARRIATNPQCAAVERELETLLSSETNPDAWLAAVANLDGRQANDHLRGLLREDLKIHAILMVGVRPRRSRSPLAQESP